MEQRPRPRVDSFASSSALSELAVKVNGPRATLTVASRHLPDQEPERKSSRGVRTGLRPACALAHSTESCAWRGRT
jgi:hypothetical protein